MTHLTQWFERTEAGDLHIFSMYWQQRHRSILCRRIEGEYVVESIDGHPAELFSDGLRKAAQRHFRKTE
jgi:hypothetical protein